MTNSKIIRVIAAGALVLFFTSISADMLLTISRTIDSEETGLEWHQLDISATEGSVISVIDGEVKVVSGKVSVKKSWSSSFERISVTIMCISLVVVYKVAGRTTTDT